MSRGPGTLQRDVLDVLRGERGLVTWNDLKERLPLHVRDHSLHRAVRSLKKMGRVREVKVNGRRWIVSRASPGPSKADRELLDLSSVAHAQLRAVAKARGVPVPPITDLPLPERKRRPLQRDLDA